LYFLIHCASSTSSWKLAANSLKLFYTKGAEQLSLKPQNAARS
jgi:hypothetical protein